MLFFHGAPSADGEYDLDTIDIVIRPPAESTTVEGIALVREWAVFGKNPEEMSIRSIDRLFKDSFKILSGI